MGRGKGGEGGQGGGGVVAEADASHDGLSLTGLEGGGRRLWRSGEEDCCVVSKDTSQYHDNGDREQDPVAVVLVNYGSMNIATTHKSAGSRWIVCSLP